MEDQRADKTRAERPRAHVVSTLAKQILGGTFVPGEKLPSEADLSERFSVSRTALREAIRTLAGKGLIASRTRSGTVVLPSTQWNHLDPELLAWREMMEPDYAFIRSLNESRMAIEPAAARLAAERATSTDLGHIDAAFAWMNRATTSDIDDAAKADEAFHFAVLVASHNPFYASFGAVIGSALRMSFRLTTSASANYRKTLQIHGEVLEAIRMRDPVLAGQVMHQLVAMGSSDLARITRLKEGDT
ncbi:FadR/GntR family transcriptional regulator [Acuticoccus sp. MNP-M23]|uniref:FadR/GntR family transcriptional regulator n=1 Tax=Acuticoccus sp. MNP-M23 TaxID=3072793 RepID=UPI002815D0C7|nr:FadR/GntR family transcriptional regulator [Acuticoccus sp. MNP-M23]WMS43557.1 FadR/GntR family transcriptional regulator [Acuticoccus sp. MNP-M23]